MRFGWIDQRWLALCFSMLGVGCTTEQWTGEPAAEHRGLGAVLGRREQSAPAAAPAATPGRAARFDRVPEIEAVPRREHDPYSRLGEVVASLGEEVERRSPGTALAIAVHVTGESDLRAEFREDVPQESASAAKIIWAGAALKRASVDQVAPHGRPAIVVSSNCAATALIDLAGGVEDVNAFYERAGMRNSGIRQWETGGCAKRTLARDSNERSNRMTAHDAISFLDRLTAGSLLPAEKKDALLSWMQASPKTGTGGWLTARLPEPVRQRAMHKAGWTERTTNELGLVTTMSNKVYAVAILASEGRSTAKQQAFVAYASCAIYQAIENGNASCE